MKAFFDCLDKFLAQFDWVILPAVAGYFVACILDAMARWRRG